MLFINSLGEKGLSEEFIKKNPDVLAEFGSVELKATSALVCYSDTGDSGEFRFRVRGTKRNGRILITWERAGSGAALQVTEISELRRFRPKRRLWPKWPEYERSEGERQS